MQPRGVSVPWGHRAGAGGARGPSSEPLGGRPDAPWIGRGFGDERGRASERRSPRMTSAGVWDPRDAPRVTSASTTWLRSNFPTFLVSPVSAASSPFVQAQLVTELFILFCEHSACHVLGAQEIRVKGAREQQWGGRPRSPRAEVLAGPAPGGGASRS